MVSHRRQWVAAFIGIGVLGITSLPYLMAARAGGADFVFGGFLLNPLDGNTYLAKMRLGWQGEWRFTLPYTSNPGQGTYLFLFYLFLGHLARFLSLSLSLTLHLARLLGAAAMLLALYHFLVRILPEERWKLWAFALAALGSGMGWLGLLFGAFTSDFWVAETYPFLSAYATPHFSLGLALLLILLTPWRARASGKGLSRAPIPFILAFALAIAAPFGVVIALIVLACLLVWRIGSARGEWRAAIFADPESLAFRFIGILAGGGPLLVYDLWAARTHPVLAGWNAQNLTPSPPVWDLLLSLAPVILLALPGAWYAVRRKRPGDRLLLAWAGLGLLLLYLPWGLQRRFMMGLFVPLAGLAAIGLEGWARRLGNRANLAATIVFILALPTNVIVLLAAQHGIQTRDPLLYLSRGEAQALAWVSEHTPGDALILAAPDTGLFVPAHSGRRVIYGHPFETVNAASEKAAVTRFFSRSGEEEAQLRSEFLAARGVDYVFFGPRERELAGPETLTELPAAGLSEVYSAAGVTILAVRR